MVVSPPTIEQLARDAAEIADPETALRALTALRLEIDAAEADLVRRALRGGASWSQVARALGITKQAAHRKYRHLFEQPLGAALVGSRVLATTDARRSIQFAREEAQRLGQPAIGTEHVLLGILRCQRSRAAKALNSLGITLERARLCLQTTLPGLPSGAPDTETVTVQAGRIIERALREAAKRGERLIGVEHLLLALLSDSRAGAVQTLEALRTTPAKVRRQLELEWVAGAPVSAGPVAAGESAQVTATDSAQVTDTDSAQVSGTDPAQVSGTHPAQVSGTHPAQVSGTHPAPVTPAEPVPIVPLDVPPAADPE